MALYLDEFLYRGRPPGSPEPPAYHVVLADLGTDAFGRPIVSTSGALTPEQAEEAGLPLPAVIAAIDSATMAENGALKARIAELETALAAAPAPPSFADASGQGAAPVPA